MKISLFRNHTLVGVTSPGYRGDFKGHLSIEINASDCHSVSVQCRKGH